MAQSILGIDIGSYSIKITELTRSLRDFELTHYYEQPIVPNPRLSHEESVAFTLKAMIEKNELNPEIVSVSVPAHHLSCRVLELPFTNIKKIEQTLDFELEGFIPTDLDDVLVDYHILSMEESRSTVLGAYMPKARFVKFLGMLEMAGIDPKYVGVDAIDLSTIAQVAMVPQEAVYAILDIGHEKTNVCVMQGQKPLYVRSISLGGLHFTKAIQKAFKLNLEKAESLKLDRGRVGLKEEAPDQISRLCQKVAEELVVYIRQTYMGFKQIYPTLDWSAIYVTGGGSRLQGLSELISAALRTNVGSLDSLEFVPHHLSRPEICRDVIALSLAQTLRVIFSNKAVKINFRRGEFAYQRDIKALGGEIKQLGGYLITVIILGISYFGLSYSTWNGRIDRLNTELSAGVGRALPEMKTNRKQTVRQLLTVLNGRITETETQLEAVRSGGDGATPLALLKTLAETAPAKGDIAIDIDNLTFNGDIMRLEGRTVSFEAVEKLRDSLSKSPYLKNITIQKQDKGVRDEIRFTLSMDVAKGTPVASSTPDEGSGS